MWPKLQVSELNHSTYEFGPFSLDARKRLLKRNGEIVPLKPKAFDTLLALVEGSGRVLEKDELMKRVWPDTVVEEGNLTFNISSLRKALGERPNQHEYIVTIPGEGYRFVAGVRAASDEVQVRERRRVTIEEEEEVAALEPAMTQVLPAATFGPGSRASRFKQYVVGAVSLVVLALIVSYLWLKPSRTSAPLASQPARIKS